MGSNPEDILDRCIDEVRRCRDPEEILQQHAEMAEELRPLLALARELSDLPEPSSSVARMMQAVAGASLRATGRGTPPARPKASPVSRPVLVRAAAVLLVVLLGGWAALAASSQTVPGDWLYPVKRFTEQVRFVLTVNEEDKAELRIVFSSERLKEAVKKHGRGEGLDPQLLEQMLEEARLAVETSKGLSERPRELVAAQAAHLSEYQQQVLSGYRFRVFGCARCVTGAGGPAPRDLKTSARGVAVTRARCGRNRTY